MSDKWNTFKRKDKKPHHRDNRDGAPNRLESHDSSNPLYNSHQLLSNAPNVSFPAGYTGGSHDTQPHGQQAPPRATVVDGD